MSNPLYKLTSAYNSLWNMVDDDDADLQSIEDTLTCIEGAIEEKAQNIAVFVQHLDKTADDIAEEIKRLQNRKRSTENKRDWLKDNLAVNMALAGKDKIKTATHSISLQNNPPAVDVYKPEIVPARYLTIIPASYVPDKNLIKADLKAGVEVPGAALTQGRGVRIR